MLQTIMFEDSEKERLDNQINKFVSQYWGNQKMYFDKILFNTACNNDGKTIHTALLVVYTRDDSTITINSKD